MSPARPLGPARLVLTFVLLSALFLLALLALAGCSASPAEPKGDERLPESTRKRKEHDP